MVRVRVRLGTDKTKTKTIKKKKHPMKIGYLLETRLKKLSRVEKSNKNKGMAKESRGEMIGIRYSLSLSVVVFSCLCLSLSLSFSLFVLVSLCLCLFVFVSLSLSLFVFVSPCLRLSCIVPFISLRVSNLDSAYKSNFTLVLFDRQGKTSCCLCV
jgi:hypothetical protein